MNHPYQELRDPYNVMKKRNIRNTDKEEYNCGGYALGTFGWYMLGHNKKEYRAFNEALRDEEWVKVKQMAIRTITTELVGWRTGPLAEVMERKFSPVEYEIVLMRFHYTDFHFWKLGRNWNWYDKCGRSPYINRHSFIDAVAPTWNDRYDSPIVGLIKKRS